MGSSGMRTGGLAAEWVKGQLEPVERWQVCAPPPRPDE